MSQINVKQDDRYGRTISHAFVTGATGLLGNNLVKALIKKNIKVTALVRSLEKAKKQFGSLPVTCIEGDILRPENFRASLTECDALFHTAAFFRESHKGGNHWSELYETNVAGTKKLLQVAYEEGIRKVVHTSSIAVLQAERDQMADETMSRGQDTKIDYYRSKILSEESVKQFLIDHPDMFVCFILPGFMFGPGDIGPTSAGQLIFNYVQHKLPGITKSSYSIVDARDVAEIHISAMQFGRQGERYLAAGHYITMEDLVKLLEEVTGISRPRKHVPMFLVRVLAQWNELYHSLTKKPILISNETVKIISEEYRRTNFSKEKTQKELGGQFRPIKETLADVVNWYQNNGYLDLSDH
ncbi:SDR family oxidoreductase [Streptococcus sp. H31]|uniref:SDR family oxidoreductase n=1 Tax=Streptococcus huangxiaojuni TaxID=3237239 RepID=UPI0034A0F72F